MHPEINENLARNVLKTVDAGLVSGIGKPVPGKMCIEAAICYALGLPHGDDPPCVGRAPRALKIKLNDQPLWPSPSARANGLRRLAIASLGSAGVVDDIQFSRRVVDLVARKYLPRLLHRAASVHLDARHRAALEAAAKRCEAEAIVATAEAYLAAVAAQAAMQGASVVHGTYINALAVGGLDATRLADVLLTLERSVGAVCAADAALAAEVDAAMAANDSPVKTLSKFAEDCVQILVDLDSPGRAYLHLTSENRS